MIRPLVQLVSSKCDNQRKRGRGERKRRGGEGSREERGAKKREGLTLFWGSGDNIDSSSNNIGNVSSSSPTTTIIIAAVFAVVGLVLLSLMVLLLVRRKRPQADDIHLDNNVELQANAAVSSVTFARSSCSPLSSVSLLCVLLSPFSLLFLLLSLPSSLLFHSAPFILLPCLLTTHATDKRWWQ